MRYRPFGKTGWNVSEIGFGAWAIGALGWGPQSDTDSLAALHTALDHGCNFIDTALGYGAGSSARSSRSAPASAFTSPPRRRR